MTNPGWPHTLANAIAAEIIQERSKESRMANWRIDILGSDLAPNVELNIESRADETMQAGDTLYFRNSENAPDKGGAIFVDRSEAVIMKGTDRWRIEKLNDLWKVTGTVE
jgi:hypothetical protein